METSCKLDVFNRTPQHSVLEFHDNHGNIEDLRGSPPPYEEGPAVSVVTVSNTSQSDTLTEKH